MGDREDAGQLEFELRFERVLTLTDGHAITGTEQDILLRPEGVEVILARTDDQSGTAPGTPVRTILYPWHRVLSVETIGTHVAELPGGGRWSVISGGDDERRRP